MLYDIKCLFVEVTRPLRIKFFLDSSPLCKAGIIIFLFDNLYDIKQDRVGDQTTPCLLLIPPPSGSLPQSRNLKCLKKKLEDKSLPKH